MSCSKKHKESINYMFVIIEHDIVQDSAFSPRKMPIRTLPSIRSGRGNHTRYEYSCSFLFFSTKKKKFVCAFFMFMLYRMMHKDQGHVLDFMLDRESFATKGQRKLKFPSAVGIVDSSVSGRFLVCSVQ